MMQLDHMTRGRAMFGVGPGSLIYDADKIGLKAADQRRSIDESLDVHRRADAGRHGHASRPTGSPERGAAAASALLAAEMEMAVACSRSPVGAVASGKHGIGMLSIGGTSDEALHGHAKNWSIHEEEARKAGKTADRSQVAHRHLRPRRRDAREGARRHGISGSTHFAKYFTEVATFPIIPPGVAAIRSSILTSSGLACIGTPDDCIRHFERLWKGSNGGFGARPAAGPQLGRLGGDQEELRADGALRPSALPAPGQHAARSRATTTPPPSTRPPARSPRKPSRPRSSATPRPRARWPAARRGNADRRRTRAVSTAPPHPEARSRRYASSAG